jgi:HAD superfamily hydrolase (TIGR01484 family)
MIGPRAEVGTTGPLAPSGHGSGTRPSPWAKVAPAALDPVRGVMTDIDDTLTRDGEIEPTALDALARLSTAGVPVVAITGRPMGWSERFVKAGPQAWPVAAIVAENGAVALMPQGDQLRIEYAQDAATRAVNARRLREVAERILREVPGTTLARDSAGRVTDIAIDHAEFARLDAARIAQVVALMRSEGMNATVSSIHINGWFGAHDKWSGACWIVERLFGRPLAAEVQHWLYVGDSPNDQLMFRHFPLSVGVANLLQFADQIVDWPAFITRGERGEGFAEVARTLLAAREPAQ